MPNDPTTPWLLGLADRREIQEPRVESYYDDDSQMTRLREPDIAMIDHSDGAVTKKADRESGEDQKERW